MTHRCICSIVAVVLALKSSVASSAMIGINFGVPGYNYLGANEIAGAPGFEQSNWNNRTLDRFFHDPLYDNSGNLTSMTISLKLSYQAMSLTKLGLANAAGPDEKLFDGGLVPFLIDGGVSVELENVPYSQYYVVLYLSTLTPGSRFVASAPFNFSRHGLVMDPNEEGQIDGDLGTPFKYTESIYSPFNPTANANYAVFDDLPIFGAQDYSVGFSKIFPPGGGANGTYLAALQVVSIPELSSASLVMVFGVTFLLVGLRKGNSGAARHA